MKFNTGVYEAGSVTGVATTLTIVIPPRARNVSLFSVNLGPDGTRQNRVSFYIPARRPSLNFDITSKLAALDSVFGGGTPTVGSPAQARCRIPAGARFLKWTVQAVAGGDNYAILQVEFDDDEDSEFLGVFCERVTIAGGGAAQTTLMEMPADCKSVSYNARLTGAANAITFSATLNTVDGNFALTALETYWNGAGLGSTNNSQVTRETGDLIIITKQPNAVTSNDFMSRISFWRL